MEDLNDEKIVSVKRFLRRYRKNVECIKRLEEKLAVIDERLTTINSPNYSGMPRGGLPITVDDLLSDQMELVDRIKRLKNRKNILKSEILETIDSLEDSRYCEILEEYFIEGLTLDDIADNLGYTQRHVFRLYSEAISLIASSKQ